MLLLHVADATEYALSWLLNRMLPKASGWHVAHLQAQKAAACVHPVGISFQEIKMHLKAFHLPAFDPLCAIEG